MTTGPVDEQNSKVRKDSNTSDGCFLFDSLATLPWGYTIYIYMHITYNIYIYVTYMCNIYMFSTLYHICHVFTIDIFTTFTTSRDFFLHHKFQDRIVVQPLSSLGPLVLAANVGDTGITLTVCR